jgi:hypothetical protein
MTPGPENGLLVPSEKPPSQGALGAAASGARQLGAAETGGLASHPNMSSKIPHPRASFTVVITVNLARTHSNENRYFPYEIVNPP